MFLWMPYLLIPGNNKHSCLLKSNIWQQAFERMWKCTAKIVTHFRLNSISVKRSPVEINGTGAELCAYILWIYCNQAWICFLCIITTFSRENGSYACLADAVQKSNYRAFPVNFHSSLLRCEVHRIVMQYLYKPQL